MKRSGFGLLMLILSLAFFAIVATGCPGPKTPQDNTGSQQTDNRQATGTNSDNGNEAASATEVPEDQPDPETQRIIEENFGQTSILTQEDIENITDFGSILYPGAQLLPDESIHQIYDNGSEIYNLKLGVEAPVETVSAWYRENSESGVEEFSRPLGSGVVVDNFQYESPGGGWTRIITVKGGEGERQCQITVNISRMVQAPEEGGE
ncbi:MAG: hypothetical protein NTY09_13420 [bacterium]|nr:hypothetical protein [bacterium]